MNKEELVALIAVTAGITKKDTAKVINAFVEVVADELQKGQEVRISGFGNFSTVTTKARSGRNPRTGEPVAISEGKRVKFLAGEVFKREVAKEKQ